jgi:hypothetical protein
VTFARRLTTAVVVVLAFANAVACTSTTSAAVKGAPRLDQVSALLARHGAAVTAHSTAAFLADVDASAPAAAFRNRQQTEIAALPSVPLTSWTYAVVGPVSDASATELAAKRYGAPALIVHLTLTYRFARVDPVPSTHDLWWTFVRRAGQVLAAGDDDLAGTGGVSWRGPWDYGPVVVHRGAASLVIGHPGLEQSVAALGAAADAAVQAVTDVVATGWAHEVAIFVPSGTAEFDALSGGQGSSDTAAVTTFDGGTTAGTARIVVRPATVQQLSGPGLAIVLRHEITHVATASATTPESPRWLIEGFAEYVANLGSDRPVRTAAAELAAQVQQDKLPTALPSDTDFQQGGTALAAVYEQSWLACVYLASRLGPQGVLTVYRQVGASTAPNDTATSVVLAAALHEPFATFLTQWRAYLKDQLG